MNKNRTYLLFFFFIQSIFIHGQDNLSKNSWNEQGTCRRHIIIAVDGSGPFFKAVEPCTKVKNVIKGLLTNKVSEVVAPQVYHELQNGIPFFDESTDEVSVFVFVMGSGDWQRFHYQFHNSVPSNFIQDVNKTFLHKVSTVNNSNEVLSIIDRAFRKSSYADGNEITLSHFVYPTILDVVPCARPAEEYIFILVSDFVSGSYGSSKQDQDIMLRDVMCYNHIAFSKYMAYYKQLNSQFYRIDYFDYAPADRDGTPACYGYKIKPMVGKGSPENVSISIESDLDAKEVSIGIFTFAPLNFKFTHNNHLSVSGISLEITKEGTDQPLYNNMLAVANEDGVLHMVETDEKVCVDTEHDYYILPKFTLPLSNLSFGDDAVLTLKFRFITRIVSDEAPVIPYVYVASRELAETGIDFIDENLRKLMTILSVALLTCVFLFIAIWRGRKKEAAISVSAFLDEYVDVTPERGAVRQSCLFHVHGRKPSPIPVKGRVRGAHRFFAIPWRTQAFAIIDNSEMKVEGVTYGVNDYIIREDERDIVVPIDLNNGRFKFNIDIYIDPKLDISKVRDMKIDIWIAAKSGLWGFTSKDARHFKLPLTALHPEDSFLQVSTNTLRPYEFRFFLIEDIGNTWVGIDPGTTGSCMAICGDSQGRADSPRIQLVEVKYGQSMTSIIPSKLVLAKKSIVDKNISEMVPGVDYDYGVNAEQTWTMHISQGHNCYQSIKKLLGYKKTDDDKIVAKFDDGNERRFSGVELAHLLVKGLKKSLDDYLASLTPQDRQVIMPDGKEARRAVVAIPNNYTLSKTLDMVNSVKMLGTFQEVRFIYEAEGVLFNYLRMTYGKKKNGAENIMVFDMGGATINVSIFKVNYFVDDHTIRFKVRTLSRIGYAVGGDNIDVALLESIFTMDELKGMPMSDNIQLRHNFEARNKTKFLNEIFGLKKEIVALQKDAPAERLSNYGSFENFVKKFEESLPERTFEALQEGFTKRIMEKLTARSKPMQEFIYDNIADAVSEVLSFREVTAIDRVIFSGRSTMFPGVKDKVKKALNSMYKNVDEKIWEGLSDDEIKTCVANGACWYGRYGLVQLDNSLINGSYGFKHTDEDGPKLHVVLDSQLRFDGDKPLIQSEVIESAFAGDANNICFYQIMGNGDTQDIFNEKNRHKLNFLGAIHAKNKTNMISISVDRQNKVKGVVLYESDHEESLNVEAEDHDLVNENEWPYIFHTLTDDQKVQSQPAVGTATTDSKGGRRRR